MVSTLLFALLLGIPVAFLTTIDQRSPHLALELILLGAASILAAIVVWSDEVPWPGDN